MTGEVDLRKEKDNLKRNISKCEYYISFLQSEIHALDRRLRWRKIKQEDYDDIIKHGLDGKGYYHYINLYNSYIKRYKKRITEIDKRQQAIQKGLIAGAVLIVVLLSSFLILYNGDITGQAVFNVLEMQHDAVGMELTESGTFTWQPPGRISRLSIDGEYIGEGEMSLYADDKLMLRLDESDSFEDECGSVCQLSSEEEIEFRAGLPTGGKLRIDNINYILAELNEFELDEKEKSFDMTGKSFIKDSFRILNEKQKNFTVSVYGEGELTKYLTLYDSYVDFSSNMSEFDVRYEFDLPIDLAPGEYEERIVVRYLPEEKFTGKVPREEYLISVVKGGTNLQSPSNSGYLWYVLGGVILFVVVVFVVIMFIKKKKEKNSR